MELYKIYKAIDEGLKLSLIDFGNDKILKSTNLNLNEEDLYTFNVDDYVYYDMLYKHNNKYGEKVGICVESNVDDDKNGLFLLFDHPLMHNKKLPCTHKGGYVYYISDPNSFSWSDGWKNTLNILLMFKDEDEIEGTMWELLKKNEYIPSQCELYDIWPLYRKLRYNMSFGDEYAMSSCFNTNGDVENPTVYTLNFEDGEDEQAFSKSDIFSTFVCIHINKNNHV